MQNRKALIDVLIVVMTAAAVVIGMSATQQSGYQLGFATARSLVENSPLGKMIQTSSDVRTISGTVTSIAGTRIGIRVVSNDPFDILAHTILVASSTEITKLVQKDLTVFQSEMEAFVQATKAGVKSAQALPPPEPFTFSPIDLASIKVGDALVVTTLENVKSLKEFAAHLIQVQVRPAPPTAP